jgi:hypothetical protein
MPISRSVRRGILVAGTGLSLATPAVFGSLYTDTTGTDHYGGPEVDIASVVITNDASNITFQINMNTAADIGTNHFANYEIGIQVGGGAGGQTAINGTFGTGNPAAGNPYGNSVGASTGINYWIGNFLDNPGNFSGGAQLFSYSSVSGWTQINQVPITEVYTVTPSTAFTFPLSQLGLSAGSTFNFDVWTSFGSPQGAYDSLDLPTQSAISPFGATPAYDSATVSGSTFSTTTYTVTAVPEPTFAMIGIGCAALMLLSRRRGRSEM